MFTGRVFGRRWRGGGAREGGELGLVGCGAAYKRGEGELARPIDGGSRVRGVQASPLPDVVVLSYVERRLTRCLRTPSGKVDLGHWWAAEEWGRWASRGG